MQRVTLEEWLRAIRILNIKTKDVWVYKPDVEWSQSIYCNDNQPSWADVNHAMREVIWQNGNYCKLRRGLNGQFTVNGFSGFDEAEATVFALLYTYRGLE